VRVALTHSLGRLEGLADGLRAAGFDVAHRPLIATRPRLDDETRARARALLGLPWRLYASRSATQAWAALGLDQRDGARLGAVGPGTARELASQGAGSVTVAESGTAEGLAAAVVALAPDGPVGVVQGRRARRTLVEALGAAGIETRVAIVYDTVATPWTRAEPFDVIVLASPSAVAVLPPRAAAGALLVAIGPTTQAAVADRGWRAVTATEPTAEALLAAIRGAGRRIGEPEPRAASQEAS
jgi:uroporphyrinogen-III synthase